MLVFRVSGTKPAPIPWILCGPETPSDSTGEDAGSTATIFTSGFFSFKYSPVPVIVPPVPTPATKMSTSPSVSSQISGPVVFLWVAGFAGFTNWPAMKLFGISFASSSAFSIAPFIPFVPSVRTTSAPYAFTMLRRSTLMVSGIVRIIRYPFTVAAAASPIPVFPEVGSMITEPSFKRPFASASSIIAFAIRSLTLPAGLKDSTFAISFACSPSFSSIRFSSTSGVFPTRSRMLSYTFAIVDFLLTFALFSLFPYFLLSLYVLSWFHLIPVGWKCQHISLV